MSIEYDLTNTETKYFKIVSKSFSKNNRAYWNCICKRCGKECIKSTAAIKSGTTKSCGCLRSDLLKERNRKNYKNIIGERFGSLVVIKYVGSLRGHASWECRCDCGNTIITDSGSLRAGYRTSCGC